MNATIKISSDITVTTDSSGAPKAVLFDGESVVEGNVSDDTASFVLSEIKRRTGHSVRFTGWAGPWPTASGEQVEGRLSPV